MFLKYRIMKHLQFGTYTSLEELHKEIYHSRETEKTIKALGVAVDELGRSGLIARTINGDIGLKTYSSFHEYKSQFRKAYFEIAVSVSAIIVAITSVISVIVDILSI